MTRDRDGSTEQVSPQSTPDPEAARAGTILVLDPREHTVLLLRRRDSLRFMGGFWVFPGGAVDAADVETARAEHTGTAEIAAAARATCRELREEAGLQLEPSELVHWAHWITPSAAWRRFDTHFFVALLPPGQAAHLASTESSELRWVQPDWVATEPADFPVTAPTILELGLLAALLRESASAAAMLERARARRIRTVMPKLAAGAAVMPWDAEYPAMPGQGTHWDEVACAERAGWRSRWPAVVAKRQ